MADVTNGMRGTGDYPGNMRPGNFKSGIKHLPMRVTRKDVQKTIAACKKRRDHASRK